MRPSKSATTLTIPHAWIWEIGSALAFIFWIYGAGAAAMLVRIAWRRLRLREAVSQARLAAPELEAIFVEQCRRLKISRCRILELPGLSSPGTAYVWNPVVIMPEGLDAYLDYEQIVDVLYHELMRVKRLDFLWSTFAEFAACLLFFHPAMWLALRNLGRDRELASDMAIRRLILRSTVAQAVRPNPARWVRRPARPVTIHPCQHLVRVGPFGRRRLAPRQSVRWGAWPRAEETATPAATQTIERRSTKGFAEAYNPYAVTCVSNPMSLR